MFIFDSKTDILIDSQELTFKSEYFCDFSRYFQNREFVNGDALQLSGDHFEGYLSRIIIDKVMLELSQRNCLTNVKGVTHSKMWVFAIPFQVNPVLFQNLYSLENNYLGIVPPKSEISVFQHPFSNRFQLYVHDNYRCCCVYHRTLLSPNNISCICRVDKFWRLNNVNQNYPAFPDIFRIL